MKYKVGDIVKLRDDLEVDKFYKGIKFIYEMERLKHLPIELLKHEIFDNCYKVEDYNGKDYIVSEAMIERLWGECKSTEQVSKSECKYKLIDILNKIANGELQEGTKLVLGNNGGIEYKGIDDYFMFQGKDLTREVKLIESDHFPDVGKMAEHFREDTKMIEPTDNTKIEELDILEIEDSQNIDNIGLANSIGDLRNEIREIQHKLNEVIRYINKED